MQSIVLAKSVSAIVTEDAAHPAGSTEGLAEIRRALADEAEGRFGSIPHGALVEHVMWATPGADFPVRSAALEALHRRRGFALRDALVVATRPANGRNLGQYTTTRSPDAVGTKQGRAKRARATGSRRRRTRAP